jgi:D-ribose pyranose/furanose isomerase RbsD
MAEENTASKTADTEKLTHNAKDDQTISAREDYVRYGEYLPYNNFCNELIRGENLETIIDIA